MIVKNLSDSFNPVPKIKRKSGLDNKKSPLKSGQIKKKSNKLAKLERQRDKDIVKSGICEYCGHYSKRLDPHEVYGRRRKHS